MNKKTINIVWFKRDLRFTDHEPLYLAQQSEIPILLVYFFEPSLLAHDDSDARHWRFVYESVQEMQSKLLKNAANIYYFHSEVQIVFEELLHEYDIQSVFSHQEIGNKVSYDRDISMQSFFDSNKISWKQSQMHGVIRKLKSRSDWDKRWENVMRANPKVVDVSNFKIENIPRDLYSKL